MCDLRLCFKFDKAYKLISELSFRADSYSLGPDKPSNIKIHPAVKFLNQVSTSTSAKFKCLAPAIDMWYDDGKDGSFQGTLTVGKESTINTYEGHVFFFTEKVFRCIFPISLFFRLHATHILFIISQFASHFICCFMAFFFSHFFVYSFKHTYI